MTLRSMHKKRQRRERLFMAALGRHFQGLDYEGICRELRQANGRYRSRRQAAQDVRTLPF